RPGPPAPRLLGRSHDRDPRRPQPPGPRRGNLCVRPRPMLRAAAGSELHHHRVRAPAARAPTGLGGGARLYRSPARRHGDRPRHARGGLGVTSQVVAAAGTLLGLAWGVAAGLGHLRGLRDFELTVARFAVLPRRLSRPFARTAVAALLGGSLLLAIPARTP